MTVNCYCNTITIHSKSHLINTNQKLPERPGRKPNLGFQKKIQEIRVKCRALERRSKKSKQNVEKETHKNCCKSLVAVIKKAKIQYYTDTIMSGNQKATQKVLNTLLKSGNKQLSNMDSHKAVSEAFSEFFVNKVDGIMTHRSCRVRVFSCSLYTTTRSTNIYPP